MLVQNYNVRSVPLTIINEYSRLDGVASEAQLLEKVLEAGAVAPVVSSKKQE